MTASRVAPFQVSRFLDTFQRFTDHCYETIQMHRHLFNPQSAATFYSIEYLLRSVPRVSTPANGGKGTNTTQHNWPD